jgi:hypothetical protein
MKNQFELFVQNLFSNKYNILPDLTNKFCPDAENETNILESLNISFLILLSGSGNSLYKSAKKYINNLRKNNKYKLFAEFYLKGIKLVSNEIKHCIDNEPSITNKFEKLNNVRFDSHNYEQIIEHFWSIFFPEGIDLLNSDKRREKVDQLRETKKINITELNNSPVLNPCKELLFTSNVLLTTPLDSDYLKNYNLSDNIKEQIKSISSEKQKYWYDHPIPFGINPEKNEVIYGLKGLTELLSFEKSIGNAAKNEKLNCLLSVSVTHKRLHKIAKEYLTEEIKKSKSIKDLNIYVFTEKETEQLIAEILIPIAKRYLDIEESELENLCNIFGVDGEYGRHYSFLKAIAALWQVFIDNEIKGTFKIDLDQVFPNKELKAQSKSSTFEHFKSPLWGAKGRDAHGNNVYLSMIAGALVNESDIEKSLYYPDVRFPKSTDINPDEYIFYSRLPQALSTEAEMMEKYNSDKINGENIVLSRVHVTGGTNGILINALRKYRPFTPSFIGRAEDQAYLMSVLFEHPSYLRYLHKSGLIMRHDKHSFAGKAIKEAETGKIIGDYVRILLFSYYAKMLPWSINRIKAELDPFTGCFISRLPYAVVYLRFVMLICSHFNTENEKNKIKATRLIKEGIPRLNSLMENLENRDNDLQKKYINESRSWHLFYDILDIAEKQIKSKNKWVIEIRKKAIKLFDSIKIM